MPVSPSCHTNMTVLTDSTLIGLPTQRVPPLSQTRPTMPTQARPWGLFGMPIPTERELRELAPQCRISLQRRTGNCLLYAWVLPSLRLIVFGGYSHSIMRATVAQPRKRMPAIGQEAASQIASENRPRRQLTAKSSHEANRLNSGPTYLGEVRWIRSPTSSVTGASNRI